jgi:hypothetical protein
LPSKGFLDFSQIEQIARELWSHLTKVRLFVELLQFQTVSFLETRE